MKSFLLISILTLSIINTQNFYAQKSSATIRLEAHKASGNCDVNIPNPSINPDWNIEFEQSNLKGDLAPNDKYTRRDPSSVLKVNGKYYVWYSYSLSGGAGKVSPWDLNDLYYATSADGYTWDEQGVAVARGAAGSYDHRSAFTTEVFYHDKMFYLVYQASDTQANLNTGNTIAMAYSSTPDGPWTKLDEPILYPSSNKSVAFDKNAVHDPCIVYFNQKFYMYYKGEGNEEIICGQGMGIWGNYTKQVKWGVAIADKVTGPYMKSDYNPITNTGHEVCVWNSGQGIGIMLHQDGPEHGTTQYAADGINFEIMGKVDFPFKDPSSSTFPEAAGVYRPVTEETSAVSGVSWGLSHVLNWQGSYGQWMYMRRFDNKNKSAIVDDSNNQGILLSDITTSGRQKSKQLNIYPNPANDYIYICDVEAGVHTLEVINVLGEVVLSQLYDTSNKSGVNLSGLNGGFYIIRLVNTKNDQVYSERFIKN